MTISFSAFALVAVIVYSLGAIVYVYRWRGRVRYARFSQYLRKSWPVFAPLNCLMYMTTRKSGRRAVLNADYLKNIELIRSNWLVIRDEALALEASGAFDAAKKPNSVGYYDLGFRTFYKHGWSKFYLIWYGTTHASALRLCPHTVALVNQVPGIRGAMFSILPAGAELSQHSDPMACSFRYHLGLATPNARQCSITVDGVSVPWFDGKDFVFDETYPHRAHNNTASSRLILMCDVDRPLTLLGRLIHPVYRFIAKATLVPNTAEDVRGIFSALFFRCAPLRQRTLEFKEKHPRKYKALKFVLNTAILANMMATVFTVFYVIQEIVT